MADGIERAEKWSDRMPFRSNNVIFLRTEQQPTATYHVYRGPNLKAALKFLRETPVKDELIYNIVETPEGNVGRDLICIFRESDGKQIELGSRPSGKSPTPSTTRCAWCGFFIRPYQVAVNGDKIGSLEIYFTYDQVRGLVTTGGGFDCVECSLLQCAVCSGLASPGGSPETLTCRACGGKLSVRKELGGGYGRQSPAAVGEDGKTVTFPADPGGDELWGMAPLRVPWSIDVPKFLGQGSLPYLWPDDKRYMSYMGTGDTAQRLLRASWINVFLHHPNPDVVLQCLRDAPPEGMLNLNSFADLLASSGAEPHVKQEAAKTAWSLSDGSLRHVLNVLLSRGLTPSNYEPNSVHQAITMLRAACPPERIGWLDSELAGPDDE